MCYISTEMPESSDSIEKIIGEITVNDSKTLCREVMSISDTMDVLRSKWTVEIRFRIGGAILLYN